MLKAANAADHADQAVEDRSAAARRRQQEHEEDQVASTHLRRNGLPTRVLVDKVRGRWSVGAGGVGRQVAIVANALSARRISMEAAQKRGPPGGVDGEYIQAQNGTIVLARHLQDEILDRIDRNWRLSEQGKECVQKARERVAAAARRRGAGASTPVLRRPASTLTRLDHGRGADASTPDQTVVALTPDQAVGTRAQFERAMKGYFKTHCDQAYGGILWLKFLITLEDIPEPVVELVNVLAMQRTKDRRGMSHNPRIQDETPGNIFLRREDRASTPVPDDYVAAKTRRQQAYRRVRMLSAWRQQGAQHVSQRTMDRAVRALHDAEDASMFKYKDYWGDWQNDF